MKVSTFARNRRRIAGALATAAGIGLLGGLVGAAAMQGPPRPSTPAYLQAFPNFEIDLTPQLPGDVDTALKSSLENANPPEFPLVQREFDLYSWQMFIALAWPTNNQGQPAPKFTDTAFGSPYWTLWHNSSTIFQTDGARPAACGTGAGPHMLAMTRDLSKPVSRGLAPFSLAARANADTRKTRFLGVISAVGELNASNLSEIDQAFSGPLIDQNGQFVFYEIMIDPNEVSYLCQNSLYNIQGQVAFAKKGGKVDMPIGQPNVDRSGAFELKLAWKIMTPGKDDPTRFYTSPAVVIDQGPDGKPVERHVIVGLVGMHIGHKSSTSPQWIWSTFEQVDNLDVDPVAHPKLHPNFFDPNCWLCAVNQQPKAGAHGAYPRVPTQAWRGIPIPGDKVHLNQEAQAALAGMGSVWQYYQLIDTQWPTGPSTAPSPWNGGLPGAVANKPGGNPTPVFLTNITMETYFQGRARGGTVQTNTMNSAACASAEVPDNATCPPVSPNAAPPVWTSPLNNLNKPVKPGINTLIFATESCMGCHSSAGIWTSYDRKTGKGTQSGQLTGDFSWLLAQKANPVGGQPPTAPLAHISGRRPTH
ncbi:MAG TPA: hypothetical protein VFW19_02810 [Allosphingosinicella sp.]|nr:hypothetical protein [Allosphingosinicella sp.]